MRERALAAMLLLATLTTGAAVAGECDLYPQYKLRPRVTCAGIGYGVCKVGETVKFDPYLPDDPTAVVPSCVNAHWAFQRSGAPSFFDYASTKGSESFTRTFDGGSYVVILSADAGFVTGGGNQDFRVANGWLTITGPSTVNEGEVATFTFTRTSAELSTVIDWYSYRTVDFVGMPIPPSDLIPVSGTVTMNAGERTKQFSVTMPPNNTTYEPAKKYGIGPTAATNYYLRSGGNHLFTLIDDDVSYLDMDPAVTVREDAGSVSITARRSGNVVPAWTIYYSTTAPVGAVPSDQAWFFFEANVSSRSFTVPIVDDHVWSGDSAGVVQALNSFVDGPPVRIRNGTTVVRVLEDDPLPTLSIAGGGSASEGSSGSQSGAFTVRMSAPVKGIDYFYELADGSATFGSDYTGTKSGILHFDATHLEQTIPFQIVGDTTSEPSETFRLHLSRTSDYGFQIALPPDATFTIVNDDAALTPGTVQIPKGEIMRFTLDVGPPAASAMVVPLSASDPTVASFPSSVPVGAGQSRATFNVTGAKAGSTRITATLPGGQSVSSMVTVHESATALFDPNAITAYPGEETAVRVSLKPASAKQETLRLSTGNPAIATVPAEVLIPAGGSGTFAVTGVGQGATYLNAILPTLLGGGTVTAPLDVIEKPAIPTITSIEPASGSAVGGAPFLARGSLLGADCRLLFGDAPAKSLTLTSEGMLAGTTPPHATGAVDVTLVCGTDTFVLTKAFTYLAPSRNRSARH